MEMSWPLIMASSTSVVIGVSPYTYVSSTQSQKRSQLRVATKYLNRSGRAAVLLRRALDFWKLATRPDSVPLFPLAPGRCRGRRRCLTRSLLPLECFRSRPELVPEWGRFDWERGLG